MKASEPPRGVWQIVLTAGGWREYTNGEQFEAAVWSLVQTGESVEWVEFNGQRWDDCLLQVVVDEIAYAVAGGEP